MRTYLKRIEHELTDIRKGVKPSWKRLLFEGLLRAAGLVAGTVLAIALLGWSLTLFGVIPGLEEISERLNQILNARI